VAGFVKRLSSTMTTIPVTKKTTNELKSRTMKDNNSIECLHHQIGGPQASQYLFFCGWPPHNPRPPSLLKRCLQPLLGCLQIPARIQHEKPSAQLIAGLLGQQLGEKGNRGESGEASLLKNGQIFKGQVLKHRIKDQYDLAAGSRHVLMRGREEK